MHSINPYVLLYKQARDNQSYREIRLSLQADIPNIDQRRYNAPTVSQVGVIILDTEASTSGRALIIETQGNMLHRISETNAAYDPLQYPLLFPRGETGWSLNIPYRGAIECTANQKVTIKQYTSYRLQIRKKDSVLRYNIIHKAGRLFQQYIVDMFAKMEQNNFSWIRANQSTIRAELYQGLQDALSAGDRTGSNVGRRIVLPSSVKCSPRQTKSSNLR